jgi:hypothetical protein
MSCIGIHANVPKYHVLESGHQPAKYQSSLLTLPNRRALRVACPGNIESHVSVPFIRVLFKQ